MNGRHLAVHRLFPADDRSAGSISQDHHSEANAEDGRRLFEILDDGQGLPGIGRPIWTGRQDDAFRFHRRNFSEPDGITGPYFDVASRLGDQVGQIISE